MIYRVSRDATRAAKLLFVAVAALISLLSFTTALAAPCDIKNSSPPFIDHDLTSNAGSSNSWCELCGYGYVTIVVTNRYSGATMTNLTVTENLGSSGLTYAPTAPTPVRYRVNGGGLNIGVAPTIGGTNGSVLTFTSAQIPPLASLDSSPGNGSSNDTVTIIVAVKRAAASPYNLSEEGLVTANRTIRASLTFSTDSGCSGSPQSATDVLPLREPIPSVVKTGWNYDAGQRQGTATNPVYGGNYDDVVWRVRFNNTGLAGLQDLRFDDLMQAGNLVINYACPTQATADAVAANNGVAPGGSTCVSASNTINDFIVTNPFGARGLSWDGYEVDVFANNNTSVYLVGKITATGSCTTVKTNTVSDVQWGCGANPPAGGITTTSTGTTPSNAVARLYTRYGDTGTGQSTTTLTVQRAITGVNTSQPVGSRGLVTITITNNTAGTVKNIRLTDVLPPEYVIDPTYWTGGFTKTLQVSGSPIYGVNTIDPQYGTYSGMIDRINWINPAPNTLSTTDPTGPLANTAPVFTLTSTTSNPSDPSNLVNMLRNRDVVRVTFPIVLIKPTHYDKVANLDVRVESPTSTPPGTDPDNNVTLTNTLTVEFDTLCTTQPHQTLTYTGNGTATNGSAILARPEDLDVDITGSELIFILTNDPAQPLTLPVTLTNNGGHDARNYHLFVTFGATMQVQSAPAGCSVIALTGSPPQPAPWKTWVLPAALPATATTYHCTTSAAIAPGQTVPYNFTVIKSSDPARVALDDLSFRADVVGEINLWNGTSLWFPTPTARPDGQTDRANDYSLDGIRARVIGFNLLKSQVGTCTENNPPPATPDLQVQIGEECRFHIDTGGWFGFQTPGFTYIAVQDIKVVDQLPDGQGYVSSTDPYATGTTSAILGISLNPAALQPLDEGWIDWTFNRLIPSQRITVKDEWFRVDMVSRILNDPIDTVAAPNQHAALSTNVLNSYFQAVFYNDTTLAEEVFNLGPGTVGYPNEAVRRVSLTITEPRITVSKLVCNETLYGAGPTCSNFVPLASDGDARNSYIYRVTLTNQASSSGVARAPAYDVTATDILDASDLAYVLPFNSDGLDNDGDGLVDGADSDGEGTIVDNTVKNGTPATVRFAYTNSSSLLRINAGQSVTLYYRVDFDDDAAPQQQFVNSVSATYDSLTGASGNQSAPQKPNSDKGGARVYTSPAATSTVRIIPVLTQPKSITRLSNTAIDVSPQPVVIGEEVEYQLVTSLPVALLRNFVITDQLPAGIRCSEAPAINLNAAPYSSAGFVPGGIITPTCTNTQVQWNFGDQRVTQGTTNNRYDFAIRFIARVDNSATNNSGTVIRNGGTSTSVTATYVDQSGATVTLSFGEAAIVVREPTIVVTKAFAVANADADDVLTVTVTARNSGNVTAYNLQVLDDLAAVSSLTYDNGVGDTNPPDIVDTTTLGSNRPIFRWSPSNPSFAIAPNATIRFTFNVKVDIGAQPREILNNLIQARWTSLPGQTTALNSTGLIGADGSLTGLRNGALPNAGNAINDYETSATAAVTVPAPTATKTDLSPAVIPAIGAYKNFQIEIRLPEGTSNNVSVSDNLAATGISYLLANNAIHDITYSFDDIATINGKTPAQAVLDFDSVWPQDGATGTVVWNFGTVVTTAENDAAINAKSPAIRINYYARVNNDLVTDDGDTLANTIAVSYAHGETGAIQTINTAVPAVTVREPVLTLGKTASNVTVGKNATDPPVVGDILEYRVSMTNTGTSTAFDINVVDTLPPGLELDAGFVPTAKINGLDVVGFGSVPSGGPAGPLVWGRGNGDGSLDLPINDILVLTYRTEVKSILDPNGLIVNGVVVDWTSLNNADPDERTGSGCPTITAPNDYCIGPVSSTTIGTRPILRFEKTVFNVTTGQSQPASPALLTASPGDVLRYRLRVQNISSSPVMNFRIIDELDRLNALPMFVPGSLTLTTVPVGADISNTNATGGAKGTGLVDVRNLSVTAASSAGDTVIVEFQIQLAPVIVNGTVVSNQAQMYIGSTLFADSDDPVLNGAENPGIAGDEDPTSVRITSAPVFRVQKTSQDLTGDPAVLEAGDTLRYTITVKNIGTENATDVSLRDQIPANTTYVPGSTALNSVTVPDPTAGVSALQNGFLIHAPAPEDVTPGVMRADAGPTAGNVATITFSVVIDANVLNGTVISNQGFVNGSGSGGPLPEQPSDDPATPAVDDPTLNVVGNLPLVYAHKTVQIQVDNGSSGILDPGDVLRYTITITNTGAIPATGVVFTDALPANTTYVANSVQMNGLPVGQPDGGVSPLVAGVPVSSSDLTPPLPGAGAGVLSPGRSATITFDVQVNGGVPTGTIISNQGTVSTNELFPQLTDADGNSSNGYQPTQIVVGNAQQLLVTKQVAVVGGGAAEVGKQLEYVVTVTNISTVPSTNVLITDTLPAQLSYVPGSAIMNGATTGVSVLGQTITGDYSSVYGDLAPGATVVLRFRASIDSGAIGATITNTAVVTWNSPTQTTSASASVDIGGVPGSGILNGRVWHDANFDNVYDSTELKLANWGVQVYANSVLLGAAVTDANGQYTISGLTPNSGTANQYELRFRSPGSGAGTALLGLADSAYTNGLQRISDVIVTSGSNQQNLNLPIDPDGVVYNSILRNPVAGATLTMLRASTQAALPAGCFDDAAQQGQVTLASGYYKFDLNFSDLAACPPGADYLIQVTPPATGYTPGISTFITPASSAITPPYSVPSCPADAVATPAGYCEAQSSEFAPPLSVPPQTTGTLYYLNVTLGNTSVPGDSQLFNNHIPVDPELGNAISITKVSPLVNVTRGQLVPYTITLNNTLAAALPYLTIIDTMPPGFKYVAGSAQYDGVPTEPVQNGRDLSWPNLPIAANSRHTIKLLLIVGGGVSEGEYVNHARVANSSTGGSISGEATATVRVVPDPTFDCTDIIGKVFDDVNADGRQNPGEKGLAGVRIVSANGLIATTDKFGRYHISCAAVPNEDRGSNFILKLDERSLPSGYRTTTENPLVLRATRGKMMKFNFGAGLHRVVRLDISDAVFEPNTTDMRPQWKPRLGILLEEIKKSPAILRLSYLADIEDPALAQQRLAAIENEVATRWQELNCCYALTIETEIYWRRGAPPVRKALSHD